MHRRLTQGLAAIAAAALLFTATTAASARIFSATEQSFKTTWSSMEMVGAATVRCRVTAEGSFHSRTIAKVRGALIGYVTRVITGHPCTGGEAWADNGTEAEPLGTAPNRLPYHISYENFGGTLPNIFAIGGLVNGMYIVIEATVLGFNCRGRYGRPEDFISTSAAREGGGGITSMSPVEGRNRLSLVEQLGRNAVCGATVALRGTSNPPTTLAGGGRVTITLI